MMAEETCECRFEGTEFVTSRCFTPLHYLEGIQHIAQAVRRMTIWCTWREQYPFVAPAAVDKPSDEWIALDPLPGTDISKAAVKAVNTADARNRRVMLIFNEEHIRVHPGMSATDVVALWSQCVDQRTTKARKEQAASPGAPPSEEEIEAAYLAAKKPGWHADRRVIERGCFKLGVNWLWNLLRPQLPEPEPDPCEVAFLARFPDGGWPDSDRARGWQAAWSASRQAKWISSEPLTEDDIGYGKQLAERHGLLDPNPPEPSKCELAFRAWYSTVNPDWDGDIRSRTPSWLAWQESWVEAKRDTVDIVMRGQPSPWPKEDAE